jgi:hypothetical protein
MATSMGLPNIEPAVTPPRALAELVPGARVKLAISHSQPVESSTAIRRRDLTGLQSEEHHFVRRTSQIDLLPLYFIVNVIATDNTTRAARALHGWGTGLASVDASNPFNSPATYSQTSASRQDRPLMPRTGSFGYFRLLGCQQFFVCNA